MKINRMTGLFIGALMCGLWTSPLSAESTRGAEAVDFIEITPEARRAIDRGLVRLASTQTESGSFGKGQYGQHVGITALGCLAFMADGHLPGRGEYGAHIEKGLQFILRNAQENGLVAADVSHGPMYGHGFATLFLGEIYGMTGDPRVRDALIRAVQLIVQSQNPEGGWRYQPTPVDADLSVTICQVMALRSARNAGVSVPKETIERAISYVRRSQNPSDGGFRYMLSSGGGSAFPRSAAGVAALYYAGVYEGDAVDKGLAYLINMRESARNTSGHYYYGQYYAVQAMYLAGGEYWRKWCPLVRDELVDRQQANGAWNSSHGDAYGTAMALLVLQTPNRLLPIFQR